MLSHGHLSMPAHPLGAFFDTFYVITDRAYASQYFPGAAMMFAPGVWLGFESWVMPLLITGAACGMMFLVIRELFDGLCGLASVVILCGVQWTRFLAIVPVAQEPTLLLGLFAIFATFRWLATNRTAWICWCGFAIGWMAITRPLDAAVYSMPLAVLIFASLYRRSAVRAEWMKVIALGAVPLIPFLALQLTLNYRVTGNAFQTPFAYYANRDLPGTSLGFHEFDPSARPVSSLPQKQMFFEHSVLPLIEAHTPGKVAWHWVTKRAKIVARELLPDTLLIISIPAALLTLRLGRRWAIVSIIPLWCFAFSFYAFDFAHYYVSLLPGVLVLIFSGCDTLGIMFPRAPSFVKTFRCVLPAVIAVMAMPQFKSDIDEQFIDTPIEPLVRAFERSVIEPRTILLVRSGPTNVPQWEVVYNVNTAWPDDAKVIRAHDLGREKNRELFRYYAERQPDRFVYRYDRALGQFIRLGNVVELAETSATKGDSIDGRSHAKHDESGPSPATTQP